MKGKYVAIGLIILLISFNVNASFIRNSETKNLSGINFDDDILYVGGSGPNNYTKIQDAINDSSDGDTVFVYNGTYYEYNVTINKSINLIGENRDNTIIYGTNISNILIAFSDFINISGFTLKNSEFAISLYYGNISISNSNISSNIFGISNMFLWDWNETGYDFKGIVIIKDNIFYNNSFLGFGFNGFNNPIINVSGNKFIKNNISCGINLVNNCIISDNVFQNNLEAISIGMSVNCIIKNNQILNNTAGFSSMILFSSHITSNNICNNEYGIVIWGGSSNKIIKNNLISNNLSAEYQRWIFFEFLGKIQLFIIPNFFKYWRVISKNKWDENYWNEPRTSPYLIRGNLYLFMPIKNPIPILNFDWHPASEPYDI